MPYGPQQIPMQHPPQRRHDGSYASVPPHMRPHPGYQPYYSQQMGPMVPQYPQHYQQTWYSYQQQQQQQQQIHPVHQPRQPYYAQPPVQSPQYHPHHSSLPGVAEPHYQTPLSHTPDQSVLSAASQRIYPQTSPRPVQAPSNLLQHPPPGSASTTSTAPIQTPPSPPLSTSTTVSARKDAQSQSASPAPQRVQSPSVDPMPEAERFVPPTPWLSVEGKSFPPRAPRQRRRIPRSRLAAEPIVFPANVPAAQPQPTHFADSATSKAREEQDIPQQETEQEIASTDTPTPLASDTPSEVVSTQPTTPASPAPGPTPKAHQTPTQAKSKPVLPIVPAVPVLPQSPSSARRPHRDSAVSAQPKPTEQAHTAENGPSKSATSDAAPGEEAKESSQAPAAVSAPAKPTSWANLFRPSQASSASALAAPLTISNVNGMAAPKGETLTEVLNDMNAPVETPQRISFLQPRGLVNTGNMCYMNSVLQVLVFCTPFYDFLSKIARRAAHTFKSDTPLIDAIILFMQEYAVLDSAPSSEQLRLRLKPDDYEKYGDSFIPEYVYTAIKPLSRFREMRRGHQQDAQEFLGFLLEELHEECSRAMRSATSTSSGRTTPFGSTPSVQDAGESEGGWMEVGHKQKPAITRSSGAIASDSPVTNVFGGKLRSELKVAGNKLSVTLEPYSPLQLDIGSPEVGNIIDALKGLTRPESMQGEFQTARGQRSSATKQVFIETLPPVLILHLKRFHYDSTTKRAEKIWKKVGYPLELEIPKEVFPVTARNKYAAHGGLPRYRLTGVIYHHGKNANGGHYTVDIRRQDGKEWIRLDDTLIRRVRSEEVAEGGSEEDPKVLAAALERHNQGKVPSNRFEQIEQEEDEDEGDGDKAWSQVNGHSRSKSTMSAIVNGAATSAKSSGPQTPRERLSVKDNKVAYLLFYQRVTV